MRFLSKLGWKIIVMCSVNFWYQQHSNSLFKGVSLFMVLDSMVWGFFFSVGAGGGGANLKWGAYFKEDTNLSIFSSLMYTQVFIM